jgi:hypothetical protein
MRYNTNINFVLNKRDVKIEAENNKMSLFIIPGQFVSAASTRSTKPTGMVSIDNDDGYQGDQQLLKAIVLGLVQEGIFKNAITTANVGSEKTVLELQEKLGNMIWILCENVSCLSDSNDWAGINIVLFSESSCL